MNVSQIMYTNDKIRNKLRVLRYSTTLKNVVNGSPTLFEVSNFCVRKCSDGNEVCGRLSSSQVSGRNKDWLTVV